MRCNRHTSDLGNSVGVCSSCLRERLLSLSAFSAAAAADACRFDPPSMAFPRSVSPYVTPRKSNAQDRPFFSTPQVVLRGGPVADSESYRSIKKKGNGFSWFSNLFRTRSDEFDSDFKCSVSDPRVPSRHSCDAITTSASSRSWLSTALSGHMKKQPTSCFTEDMIAVGDRRAQRVFCRGMSPVMDSDSEDEREPTMSASVMESPGRLKRTPATDKMAAGIPSKRKKTRARLGKSVSGMTFCLSPLVRARPGRHRRRKGNLPPEIMFSCDPTVLTKPHISTAASYCANRSKKLVDLGRANHRR